MFLTTPTATFGSTRALEKSHGTDTSMFKNSRNVEMTITSLRCLIGTSSLIWGSRNPASIWLRLLLGKSSAQYP